LNSTSQKHAGEEFHASTVREVIASAQHECFDLHYSTKCETTLPRLNSMGSVSFMSPEHERFDLHFSTVCEGGVPRLNITRSISFKSAENQRFDLHFSTL
jgi:hypothetical protein